MNAPRGRLFRRIAGTLLVLFLGGLAVSAATITLRGVFSPPGDATGAGETADGAPDPEMGTRRERVRVTRATDDATARAAAASIDRPGEERATAEQPIVVLVATASGQPLRGRLGTRGRSPDGNDANVRKGGPRSVLPGRPPELELNAFVAAGPSAPVDAVELVGNRHPKLEEGLPVALTGRVVDLERGAPISGAAVHVTSTFYVRRYQYDHHLREVARVLTNAKGEYEIRRLNADPAHFGEDGRIVITVRAGGFAGAEAIPLENVKAGFESELPDVVLSRETHVLRGRVTDHHQNLPVEGARVVATGSVDPVSYPKDQRDALFLGAPETVTDADGRFELKGLGPGKQWVSLHYGNDCISNQLFEVPKQNDVTMRSHPARGRITGRVVDIDGVPVSLAVIGGGWNSTHSFAEGDFVLENFHGDPVDLDVAHPDYLPVKLGGIADGTEELTIRLERRQPRVRLDVRDAVSGKSLRHVTVELLANDGSAVPLTSSPHYLDETGVHEVVLPAEIATIRVSAAGHELQTADVRDLRDGDERTLVLRRTQ